MSLLKPALRRILLLLCCCLPGTGLAAERWLYINASHQNLYVMNGLQVAQRFSDIAVGRLGVKPVHFAGDTSTPAGEYRIDAINPSSHYTLFLRLNYPTPAHAEKARQMGRLSQADYDRILAAASAGRHPPQDTALGGAIGIHGIGRGSLETHRKFNWTEGCVALDNDQIRVLAEQVFVGMRVVIEAE